MADDRRTEVTMHSRRKPVGPPAMRSDSYVNGPDGSNLYVPPSIFNFRGEDPTRQLQSLPSHVLGTIRRAGIRFQSSDSPQSDYKSLPFMSPRIRIGATSGQNLVRKGTKVSDQFGKAPTIYHEVGHAVNDMMRRAGLDFTSRRFLNLCIKHRAGTLGGGGGYGEFTSDYAKSSCGELYAEGFQAYYATPEALLAYDRQLYDFFRDVDRELRRTDRSGENH